MAEIKKLRNIFKNNTLNKISKAVQEAMGAEVVCEETLMNDSAMLLCFEDFYFRNKSYTALSIMLTESDGFQEAVVVGFGGGEGLLNISWGSNRSFASRGVNALVELGFKEEIY